jgi:hypothetical protein
MDVLLGAVAERMEVTVAVHPRRVCPVTSQKIQNSGRTLPAWKADGKEDYELANSPQAALAANLRAPGAEAAGGPAEHGAPGRLSNLVRPADRACSPGPFARA